MGHSGSPYDYVNYVALFAPFVRLRVLLITTCSFQPPLDNMHPKLDNECTGHQWLITQVVNTSGCIWTGGMNSDWVLLFTRGHIHTHTQGWYGFRLSVTLHQRAHTHTHTHKDGMTSDWVLLLTRGHVHTHTHKGVHTHHKVLSISMVTSHH